MGKVDCIVEMGEEQYTAGLIKVARNLLIIGFPIKFVSETAELPIEKVKELKKDIESSEFN